MNKYLSISEAAEYLGISEQTLRRWDKDGSFKASFVSPGGHRYYSIADLEKRTKGLFQIAKEWAALIKPYSPQEEFYCPTSDIFKARLERMARELEKNSKLKEIGPLVTSIAGEIGNNSFDHNIGNWPDLPGAFFAYDLGKRIVTLADRGRGVLTTLRNIKPALRDDGEALRVAFTEILTGRAPEHRGNGLKYVRSVIEKYGFNLRFQSGASGLEIKKEKRRLKIGPLEARIQGCLALLEF